VVPGNAVIWKLLAIGLGGVAVALAVIAIWELIDRIHMRRRLAAIADVEREITARRQALDVERVGAQRAFEAESAARRRAVDAELAEHAAELQRARAKATSEFAETVRAASEIYERYTRTRAAFRAELAALKATVAATRAELQRAQVCSPERTSASLAVPPGPAA
jgi:multidrug efflux pump subunit AcrA (membrane-fusion protein)